MTPLIGTSFAILAVGYEWTHSRGIMPESQHARGRNMSNGTKIFWSVFLSFLMSNIPHVVWAEAADQPQMIATESVVAEMNRAQAQEKVREFMAREDVQQELIKNGVSPQDAEIRLASLSDFELKRLAQQMDQARAGGDVVGVLVVVLLVLLVIYFAKRV